MAASAAMAASLRADRRRDFLPPLPPEEEGVDASKGPPVAAALSPPEAILLLTLPPEPCDEEEGSPDEVAGDEDGPAEDVDAAAASEWVEGEGPGERWWCLTERVLEGKKKCSSHGHGLRFNDKGVQGRPRAHLTMVESTASPEKVKKCNQRTKL